jgi:hypothetical protein
MSDEFSGGQEVASNWFKFEKVGDGIKGTLISKRIQPSRDPAFPDQWVGELKKSDGTVWNVGVSVNKEGTVQRLQNCKVGELIGILFEKEGDEPKKKGFAKAKFLKVITWGMDPNYNEMDGGEELPPM